MTDSDKAFWLGLFGAGLSTILAVLRVREFFADRGKLRFTAGIQRTYDPAAPGAATTHGTGSEPRVVFTVTNVGRRKLRVMGFGIRIGWNWKYPKRKQNRELCMYPKADFPRDLSEGETMELDDPIYQKWLTEAQVAAFVYDSLGHRWELSRTDLRRAKNPKQWGPPDILPTRSGNAS